MTSIFGKWLKYVGNWLNYVINGLKMWKMTKRLGTGQNIWEMAQIHGASLKYLRSGFTMLERA